MDFLVMGHGDNNDTLFAAPSCDIDHSWLARAEYGPTERKVPLQEVRDLVGVVEMACRGVCLL